MHRIILCFLIITLAALPAFGVTYQWSQRYGDSADQIPTAIGLDNSGNVTLAGHFSGSIDFGDSALVCPGPQPCAYLARLDAAGNPVWSRVLGDTITYLTNMLAVDPNGAALVASDFKGTIDMGGGPLVMQGFRDGVAAKFDADGNPVWSRRFGGAGALVTVKAACVDGDGNFYIAGTYTGPMDFGGMTLTYTAFTTNMFIVKYDINGDPVWTGKHTGGLIEIVGMATSSDGSLVIAGYHGGAFDFGGGALTADILNVFVVKYNSAGSHVWSRSFGDVDTQQHCRDVAVDLAGNIAIVGDFRNSIDFGGGTFTTLGLWDAFVAVLDPAGNHLWSHAMGGTSTDRAFTVAVDGARNVTVAGHFFGTADFGGGAVIADPVDFYATCFDASGNHLWDRRFDVYNLGLPNDQEYAVAGAANLNGDLAFTGSFKDAIDCGGGSLGGFGAWDAFAVRFGGEVSAADDGPAGFEPLLRAFPNPFNPQTQLTYTVPKAGAIRLDIFDVSGRRVRTLVNSRIAAGTHTAAWDGRDTNGATLASGVYFVRLAAPGATRTLRVVLLK